MSFELPKFRADLICSEQRSDEGTVYVLKDPDRDEYFRLQEAEHFIAAQLDGETPFEAVRERVETHFGATISREDLSKFVKQLDRNGLLENADRDLKRSGRRRRVNGELLFFRIRLYDPVHLFDRLIARVGFFFTPQFVVLSACAIGLAILIAAFNFGAVAQQAAGLISVSTLPLIVCTMFLMVTLHEFAHGLTCRYFGGQVRELGFLMMYFQPALYCNVSDAWLFPEKSKRLWVGFAGPYFELFLWALATMTWRLTDVDTPVNHVALVAMGVSGIMTLLNFNPLIKLDGYYLLSDWLEIPNLRRKSFRYIGDGVRTLGGLLRPMPKVSPRERRVFLTFGITAWVFSMVLLAYTALVVGELLIIEKHRVVFFLFTGLVSLRLRAKFQRLFGRKSSKSRSRSKDEGKQGPRWSWGPVWKLALLAAVASALWFVRVELRVSGPVTALPLHNTDVRAEVDGIVAEVLIDEGDRVEAGDPIARLVDHDVQAELEKTQARLDESQARLRLLEAGARPEELELAQFVVTRAEEQLQFARDKLDRDRKLYDQRLLPLTEYRESERLLAAASSDLVEAKKKYMVVKAGSRPEEIEAMRAMVASLETQHRQLDLQLRLMNVASPSRGTITTPSRQLAAMSHRYITKGELIAKVHELDVITAQIALSEKEIADVVLGQTVALKVRAYPSLVFEGRVINIATTAQTGGAGAADAPADAAGAAADTGGSPNTILVTTEIDNADGLLKPGMTGMAKIYCGERRLVDLMTRRVSRTFRVEFWSWW